MATLYKYVIIHTNPKILRTVITVIVVETDRECMYSPVLHVVKA